MILLEPVDWRAVRTCILSEIIKEPTNELTSCAILNFGPGYGISKNRLDWPENVQIVDASSNKYDPSKEIKSDLSPTNDIAIVGMGVDLPGAPDTATLWGNLISGVNSCSEVRAKI